MFNNSYYSPYGEIDLTKGSIITSILETGDSKQFKKEKLRIIRSVVRYLKLKNKPELLKTLKKIVRLNQEAYPLLEGINPSERSIIKSTIAVLQNPDKLKFPNANRVFTSIQNYKGFEKQGYIEFLVTFGIIHPMLPGSLLPLLFIPAFPRVSKKYNLHTEYKLLSFLQSLQKYHSHQDYKGMETFLKSFFGVKSGESERKSANYLKRISFIKPELKTNQKKETRTQEEKSTIDLPEAEDSSYDKEWENEEYLDLPEAEDSSYDKEWEKIGFPEFSTSDDEIEKEKSDSSNPKCVASYNNFDSQYDIEDPSSPEAIHAESYTFNGNDTSLGSSIFDEPFDSKLSGPDNKGSNFNCPLTNSGGSSPRNDDNSGGDNNGDSFESIAVIGTVGIVIIISIVKFFAEKDHEKQNESNNQE